MQTRRNSEVWLVGPESKDISGSKLPSIGQALCMFFYHHNTEKLPLRESARCAVKAVCAVWNKARIPVVAEQTAIDKVLKLHTTWTNLKKDKNAVGPTPQRKRDEWIQSLNKLFDLAPKNVMDLIKIQEDKDFLTAQREEERRGYIAGPDLALAKTECATLLRRQKESERKIRQIEQVKRANEKVDISSSDEERTEESKMEQSDEEFVARSSRPPLFRRKLQNVVTPLLLGALDASGTSDRSASKIINATAQSLGIDVNNLASSFSTIRRARMTLREEVASKLKKEFTAETPLVVHWDGKLLEDHSNDSSEEKVDRIVVVVSGGGVEQLLAVPKVENGTGEEQAEAVCNVLKDWKLVDCVAGMNYDTTNTNTGRINGACVKIEAKLQRDLLHLSCRHHVLELPLKAAFEAVSEPSQSPDIPLFKLFRKNWDSFDKSNYSTAGTLREMNKVKVDRAEIIRFCLTQLQISQPREDYKELLQLTVVFLGGEIPVGFQFRKPGAFHRARWMAKAIYAMKIWMFRRQFKDLSRDQEKAMLELSIFVALAHVKAWFVAPLPTKAPASDLKFLQLLTANENISDVWKAARLKFQTHLWYLSSELVPLALFDEEVHPETKKKMIEAMNSGEEDDDPPKRTQLLPSVKIHDLTLDQFANPSSKRFFRILNIGCSFLQEDPNEWPKNPEYENAQHVVRNIKVVNDIAERAVKLMIDFNSILTKDEEQRQYILQVVNKYRKDHPDMKKSTLAMSSKMDM